MPFGGPRQRDVTVSQRRDYLNTGDADGDTSRRTLSLSKLTQSKFPLR
jgi:hypothetical protein